jgi:hypothetical protein
MKILVMVLMGAAMASAQYQTPVRISDSVALPATLNAKVTQWRDVNNSNLFWDARAEISTASPGARAWYLRDNAGTRILELQRSAGGVVTDRALLDMHLVPRTSSARNLGEGTTIWNNGYIDNVYLGTLRPHTFATGVAIAVAQSLVPTNHNTFDLGENSTPRRWRNGWFSGTITTANLTVTGTCTGCGAGASGWTRDASGYLVPTTATDDVWVRKVVLQDVAASGIFWDLMNESTVASPGSRSVYLRDPAGTKVVEFQRSSVGVTTNRALFDLHLYPTTTNARDLGDASLRWRTGYFAGNLDVLNGVTANTLNITSGATVSSLNITSGTCTGCPNFWQSTGFSPVTLSPLSTAYNMAVGGTTASTHKLEVTGSASVSGNFNLGFGANLFWQTDGAGSIGTTSGNRPNGIYAASEVRSFDGGGSTITRVLLSGSGVLVYNSGGTQVASISGSTGRISSSAGFTVSGINGLSVTTTAGCVFTGGILTTSC